MQGYFPLLFLAFCSLNHQLTFPLSFLPHFDLKAVISPYQLRAALPAVTEGWPLSLECWLGWMGKYKHECGCETV